MKRTAKHVPALVLCMLAFAGVSLGVEADMREALSKWIETRRLISEERQDWRVSRGVLEDRIEQMTREAESMRRKTEETRQGIGDADSKLAELRAANDTLREATEGLTTAVAELERRVRTLLATAPAPIREHVRPLSQSIPSDPEDTKIGLSQRFQNIIGILNEINKFAREVTTASEVRDFPGGTSAEVTTLYLGLGQAYYSNAEGGLGGVGLPGANGWDWTPRNELAPAVADVIAIQRNEKPAAYVPLPVEIRDAGAAAEAAGAPAPEGTTPTVDD